ncbi:PaaX family transcriptional regulator [Microbacterium sp. NPDC089698]|uniref:PaaX family transcriptional regulator n=1 Tax=Microbacterium sp. NPDC089698 TaxID=3364200 RepID=UPI00380A6225
MSGVISARTVIAAFLPREGDVALADVYRAANLVGVADQPLRLALRRRAAAGAVVLSGRGRAGRLALTAAGRVEIERDRLGLGLAIAQDRGKAPWDGRWHLLSVHVPEADRGRRDALRRTLMAIGAAPASTALFLSPHDLTPLLDDDARDHMVVAVAEEVSLRGVADPRGIAEALWPAAPIDAGYDALEIALEADDPRDAPVIRRLRLADALEHALRSDPLLPVELRDGPWRPARLRTDWLQRWESVPDGGPAVFDGWIAGDIAAR